MNPMLLSPCLLLGVLSASVPGPVVPTWTDLRLIVQALRSEEGTTRLLERFPRLASSCADGNGFGDMVRLWRNQLLPLPSAQEDLDPGLATLQFFGQNGSTTAFITFFSRETRGRLTFLKLSYDGNDLEKIDFYRGFVRDAPPPVSADAVEYRYRTRR